MSIRPRTLKLFVGGLPHEASKEDLKEYFEKYGALKDYVVMTDRGFGFVTFDNAESVDAVLAEPDHEIKGKVVACKEAVPKEEDEPRRPERDRYYDRRYDDRYDDRHYDDRRYDRRYDDRRYDDYYYRDDYRRDRRYDDRYDERYDDRYRERDYDRHRYERSPYEGGHYEQRPYDSRYDSYLPPKPEYDDRTSSPLKPDTPQSTPTGFNTYTTAHYGAYGMPSSRPYEDYSRLAPAVSPAAQTGLPHNVRY